MIARAEGSEASQPLGPIAFAKGLHLPTDAVTQTFAFLARKGAGKTYAASKLAEGMLEIGAQVVVLDPVGVWWGLRLASDGKGKGFDIPVFGGMHGDIPLEPCAGALVADLVVDRGLSLVLDVSSMRKGDRKTFVTALAEQLFHRKKGTRSPLHLFVEEAQVFVPQRTMRGEERMLGAFEDLVKLGRNFGIGVTLISQRPQSVNKDALNQAEALVVLQTNGSQERKALEAWIVEQGIETKELVDQLPGLKVGEAFVWSPSWLRLLRRVHVLKKRTFDASATPELGKGMVAEPKPLQAAEMEHLRQAMAETVKRAEQEDPKLLRQRIASLERELSSASAPPAQVERVEVPVLQPEQLAELKRCTEEASEAQATLAGALTVVQDALELLRRPAPTSSQRVVPRIQIRNHGKVKWDSETGVALDKGMERTLSCDSALPKGARDMLGALAWTRLPSLSRRQVATLAGLKATGGTFQKYLSTLRTGGFIADLGGQVAITSEGLHAIGGRPPAPASTAELVAHWEAKLPAGARAMLQLLVGRYPHGTERGKLAASVNMEVSGGTFQKYLSLLRSNGLALVRDGEVMADPNLFICEKT